MPQVISSLLIYNAAGVASWDWGAGALTASSFVVGAGTNHLTEGLFKFTMLGLKPIQIYYAFKFTSNLLCLRICYALTPPR